MSFPKIFTTNGPSSTSASALPSWLTIKPRSTRNPHTGARKRQRTQHQVGQLELIQDFSFPSAAVKIRVTPDGKHAIGTGTYKPMMKVWDLEGLSVKFERVTDAENVDFVILSEDWTKTLHLQRDRSLQLHTQMGLHHTVRLPTYGRSLAYHPPSADALIGCTGTDVFRFNLEEGRHMQPLVVGKGLSDVEGTNVMDVNKRHGLLSLGLDGGGGVVEFWDPRSKSALTRLLLPADQLLPAQSTVTDGLARPEHRLAVTALASHPTDGLSLAVGTSTGHTLLYDLRSPTPFAIKDQGYGEPLITVDWLRGGGSQENDGRVVSADSKVIKVWSKEDPAENILSLHPASPLVDLYAVPHSGLLLGACNAPQLSSWYIPDLGPAPRWASFLDNVTEEMAEDLSGAGKGAFQDYKFVDAAELETLGLSHLIGTPALKPYMHGYFLKLKLYTTARLIANPQSYDEYRDRLLADKLAKRAESRIRARKEDVKVNKKLAERLRKVAEREEALERRKKARRMANGEEGEQSASESSEEEQEQSKKQGKTLLADPRFAAVFENPDFEVDEESREFALLNPATVNNNAKRKTAVEEEEEESDRDSFDLSAEESDEDEEVDEDGSEDADGQVDENGEEDSEEGSEEGDEEFDGAEEDDEPEGSDEEDLSQYTSTPSSNGAGPSRRPHQPRLLMPSSAVSQADSFGSRLASSRSSGSGLGLGNKSNKATGPGLGADDGVLAMRRGADGGMEMSFIPKGTKDRRPASGGRGSGGADEQETDEEDGRRGGKGRGPKVEKFGAGLEKGGEGKKAEWERGGRKERRHPGRSASKNVFRRR